MTCLLSRTTTSREASRTGGFRSALAIICSNRSLAASYFFGRSRVPFFKAFFMVSLTLPVLVIYPFCSKCSSSSVASSWVTVCSSTVVIVLVIPIIASAACSAVAPFLIWRMTSVTGLGGSVIFPDSNSAVIFSSAAVISGSAIHLSMEPSSIQVFTSSWASSLSIVCSRVTSS